jgi:hypothetical protein
MQGFNWFTAVNDLVTSAITIGGIVVAHRKGWVKAVVEELIRRGPQLVKDVQQVAEGVGQLVPAVGEAEKALKEEIEQLTDKARKTELYRVAAVGLHAFGAALGALSEDQRKALSFYIASRVPGATPQEIADALAFVQKEADEAAASPLFQSANAFTQAQAAQMQAQVRETTGQSEQQATA